MFIRKLSACLAACWVLECASVAADDSSCDAVLNYTGREKRILDLKDAGRSYIDWIKTEESSWNMDSSARYGIIAGKLSGGQSRSQTDAGVNFQQWQKDLFQKVDTVFEPAVHAWLACEQAQKHSNINLVPKLEDQGNTFRLDVTRSALGDSRINAIDYDATLLSCTHDGQRVTGRYELGNQVWNMICKRRGARRDATAVKIVLNTASYSFPVPRTARSPVPFSSSPNNKVMNVNGCTWENVLPAVDYQRELRFDLEERAVWNQADTSVELIAKVNGSQIHRSVEGKPPNANPEGSMVAETETQLEAFLPAHILIQGGGGPNGGCLWIRGTISYSRPQ